MSWDIFVADLPSEVKRVDELPKHFRPAPIGPRSEIIAKIQEVIPGADFSNPRWGYIKGDGWSIEVSIGDEEICDGFFLHVRGADADAAVGAIATMLTRLALRAIDFQTSEFFIAGPQAIESFRRWRQYRDQVVDQYR